MLGKIKNKNGCYNYRIPNIGALELEERELEFPPYVLGVWLADGNAYNASFTCNINDLEIADKVVSSGVEVREWKSNNTGSIHLRAIFQTAIIALEHFLVSGSVSAVFHIHPAIFYWLRSVHWSAVLPDLPVAD